MNTMLYNKRSLLFLFILLSLNMIQVHSYSLTRGNNFIGMQLSQQKEAINKPNSTKTESKEIINKKILEKTPIVKTNNSTIIKNGTNLSKESTISQLKPDQSEINQPSHIVHQNYTQSLVKQPGIQSEYQQKEFNSLREDINSVLDNIENLASQLKNTSSSTKEILLFVNDLKTEFAKMQFEYTTNTNENYKRVKILNSRLSQHFKEQLSYQLFMLDRLEKEIQSQIKVDQKKLSSLEFDIYLNSRCSSYQTCAQCSSDSSCGWCSSSDKCIEGDSTGPLVTKCDIYSYSICHQEAFCSHSTCNECISNILCSWCAQSPKPFCSKASEYINCSNDLKISLLGDNNICPSINYDAKYRGGYQRDFLKETQSAFHRKKQKEEFKSITQEIAAKKAKLEDYTLQRLRIEEEKKLIDQQKEDFSTIEEDINQKGFADDFKIKMMNVFKTELQSFFESLKKKYLLNNQ